MIRYRYDPLGTSSALMCPKCASPRTQVIGRRDDSRTLVLRCNTCGAHASVRTFEDSPDLPLDDTIRAAELLARFN